MLAYAEVVEQTNVVREVAVADGEVVDVTKTYVRNEVPDTLFVVATEHVREVEHNVLVDVVELVGGVYIACVHLLEPETVELGAETDAGGEPLTNGHVETEGSAVYAEGVLVAAILLGGVRTVGCEASAHVPVSPERVGGNTVLFGRDFNVLSKGRCGRETHKGKCNH